MTQNNVQSVVVASASAVLEGLGFAPAVVEAKAAEVADKVVADLNGQVLTPERQQAVQGLLAAFAEAPAPAPAKRRRKSKAEAAPKAPRAPKAPKAPRAPKAPKAPSAGKRQASPESKAKMSFMKSYRNAERRAEKKAWKDDAQKAADAALLADVKKRGLDVVRDEAVAKAVKAAS